MQRSQFLNFPTQHKGPNEVTASAVLFRVGLAKTQIPNHPRPQEPLKLYLRSIVCPMPALTKFSGWFLGFFCSDPRKVGKQTEVSHTSVSRTHLESSIRPASRIHVLLMVDIFCIKSGWSARRRGGSVPNTCAARFVEKPFAKHKKERIGNYPKSTRIQSM
jgi:hypothetical protein